MEKKIKFVRFMEPEKAEYVARKEFIPLMPFSDRIGGKIFKILDEGYDTVTISVDGELKKIDNTFINEIIEYDKNEILSALKTLRKVCRCHTTISGGCDNRCPFYGETENDENCKLLDVPSDWEIVDEEVWRPIR